MSSSPTGWRPKPISTSATARGFDNAPGSSVVGLFCQCPAEGARLGGVAAKGRRRTRPVVVSGPVLASVRSLVAGAAVV